MLCGVNQVGVRSRWIFQPLEKKKEHFLLLRRGKFRYRRLSGEEIFPDRQKYFQVFTTVSWYFTALAKVGDRTFTITAAAKTVGNWVKNKSQIQRRDEIPAKMQNHCLISNGKLRCLHCNVDDILTFQCIGAKQT